MDESATPPDTAVEGTDYATVDESATAITIAIAAGASSGTATATFTLTPTDDSIDDDAESLSVSGSSDLSGVTVTKDTLTIDDNDAAPTGVTLTLSDTNGDLASVSEDAGATTVTVTADVTGGTTYATAQTVTDGGRFQLHAARHGGGRDRLRDGGRERHRDHHRHRCGRFIGDCDCDVHADADRRLH